MLRKAGTKVAGWAGFHIGRHRNYHLVGRGFYSPVPDLEELPADIFDRESRLDGIRLDTAAQLAFVETELAGHFSELENHPDADFRNGYYDAGDAHMAYAMVRHLRPARIVELGSGFSTRVLSLACERNASEGHEASLTVFDPYPGMTTLADAPAKAEVHALKAQDVPEKAFADLRADDILFVDTSHTVKLGGDVNRVVLEVLPRLAPGVHVHFHDISLPYEYHPGFVRDQKLFWTEQYLLQAFLSMNPHFEVTVATRALCVRYPDRLRELAPHWTSEFYASSFWIRRVDPRL